MPTLAINTSANFVSIALLDGDRLISSRDSRTDYQSPAKQTTGAAAGSADQLPEGYTKKRSKRGQSTRRIFPPGASVMLAPLLQEMLGEANLKFDALDLLTVVKGPGMFTGLRVGVVTAKTLAFSQQIPLVGVNTLEALAAQTFENQPAEFRSKKLKCVINAQRQQLFCASFRYIEPWTVKCIDSQEIMGRSEWLAKLEAEEAVVGTGIEPIASQTESTGVQVVADKYWELLAESVAKFGNVRFRNDPEDELWSLEPDYFRPSAAEEKAMEKNEKQGSPERPA